MTGARRPGRLVPGDRVAIVAPAGPVTATMLEAGVSILTGWGLDVVIGDHVLDRHPDFPYLAGRDEDRAADLAKAWSDPDIAGVLCARGGYGCTRTLQRLDLAALAELPPKVFAGSSDVTALHQAFGSRLDLVTLFSPMVGSAPFVEHPGAVETLRRTLLEPETTLVLGRPGAGPLVSGRARGVSWGGNLSLLAADLGTVDAYPPPPGSIVLLEDVGEDLYRLDRMLTQLDRAGWWANVAGVALGSWTDCGPLEAVRTLLLDRLGGLGVPIGWELGFGHCDDQLTVPLGVPVELDADAGTLRLDEPALD
ncbi:S66 peptidase family protein [Actinoalloteichus hoggarensis]|uniref:Putative murein peptide carboxypeptidase n=1 Tax=Actinoalloteichus hoggarensis TaxID=1470176 RepID=A0A221W3A7_9PSEU|nr:LD-carboxypeptidase [Actinoalloteichus hoggarensis]ASO20275.1 putative murein peptide carboxypeptidase [Actinoalloteichus hoggarensis]